MRDLLLGRPLHDFDLTTQATWQEVERICLDAGFAVHRTGVKHGTVMVIANHAAMEITTFRTEGAYEDHRRPSQVTFTDSIEEDLARRDFTINAMAYHPSRGLLDPYNGMSCLKSSTIQCVGRASDRFGEDALRILRAIRFASQLGFELDGETLQAANAHKEDLHLIANERIFDELTKFLCGNYVCEALLAYTEILNVVLPELIAMEGLDQKTKYHIYDVYEHTAHVVANSPATPLARWAALLHDSGKPDTFTIDENGVGHMYGHPLASVAHLEDIAKRLRFPRALKHDLELIIRYHDARPAATKKSVRRLFGKMENNEYLFRALCDLMRADALGQAPFCHARVEITNEIEAIFNEMLAENAVFSLHDLKISGSDLLAEGIPQGPQIGEILKAVLHEVTEEGLENNRANLLEFVRNNYL